MEEIGEVIEIYRVPLQNEQQFYPCFILGRDYQPIRVYTGQSFLAEPGSGEIGIFIQRENYFDINNDRAYVFICYPEAPDSDAINRMVESLGDMLKKAGAIHVGPKVGEFLSIEKSPPPRGH